MIEQRNMINSAVQHMRSPIAILKNWTVYNSVKSGYQCSGWVYKSVQLISKNISAIPWNVVDKNGEIIKEHPISLLLNNPNPFVSRQDFFELISAWLQLTGEANAKIIEINGMAKELWPISPDRITPIESNSHGALISGYEIINDKGEKVISNEFTPENIIAFKFIDPANPIRGIGPLQVASKSVDIDLEQLNWNKSAMQNRGILDGVFTFKERLDRGAYNVIKQMIKERIQGKDNARDIGVIGSDARYQRLSLTPAEMDFITSRKFNREEIFIIFGIPPQLAGSQDTSTYNNFNTARVVLWENTLIPILDDMACTLNRTLSKYLSNGLSVAYDLSSVSALKKDQAEKANIAKTYFEMGVPVERLNEMFNLGIPQYDGWDKSKDIHRQQIKENRSGFFLTPFEKRSIDDEIEKKEVEAGKISKSIEKGLMQQRESILGAIKEKIDIAGTVSDSSDLLLESISNSYSKLAIKFSRIIITRSNSDVETRESTDVLDSKIQQLIDSESIILTELSLINKTTAEKIISIILDGEREGKSITQIQQGIIDSGILSPERALRIARTISGSAQSIGQFSAAKLAGATKKTWHDSGFEVRKEHQNRNGETVDIDGFFSSQFPGFPAPRWPLDVNIAARDRINCRCAMSFS